LASIRWITAGNRDRERVGEIARAVVSAKTALPALSQRGRWRQQQLIARYDFADFNRAVAERHPARHEKIERGEAKVSGRL
jgi:hypothetical protein